jgi:hypothetical protein
MDQLSSLASLKEETKGAPLNAENRGQLNGVSNWAHLALGEKQGAPPKGINQGGPQKIYTKGPQNVKNQQMREKSGVPISINTGMLQSSRSDYVKCM